MLSKKIHTLNELMTAVMEKRSVVTPDVMWLHKPKPAAVVINFQGGTIWALINSGLYIYKKTQKKAVNKPTRHTRKSQSGITGLS